MNLQLRTKEKVIRLRNCDYEELAWAKLGRSPLELSVEFPTTWHETARVWLSVGVGFARAGFSLPWKWLAKDHMQCEGPIFGFRSTMESFRLTWGQSTGNSKDPRRYAMWDWPWVWQFDRREDVGEVVSLPFSYTSHDGEVQSTIAKIKFERFYRRRFWWPHKESILRVDVSFDREMGERVNTWKGGTSAISFVPKDATPEGVLREVTEKLRGRR